jgi:hypothetical protein
MTRFGGDLFFVSLKGSCLDVMRFNYEECVKLDREIASKIIRHEAKKIGCNPKDPECIEKIRKRLRKMCMRCNPDVVSFDDGEA